MPAPADDERLAPARRRLRIIFVTMTFHPEPGMIRGLPLAKWLTDCGYEVKVITAVPNYPIGRVYDGYKMRLWQWETIDGVRVLRVPIYPSHDTSAIRRMWTYVSFALMAATVGAALIGPADAVYLYDPPPTNGIAALVLKLFRGVPIVHHIGDMWPETVTESGMLPEGRAKHVAGAIIGAFCRMLYKQAAAMTVLSPGFRRMLLERGVPSERIHVVYNWADEETFHPVPRDESLAAELGLAGYFSFVYAGNFGPFQGLDTLVRAAALVRDDPRIRVMLIGTGPVEDELKALARDLGATNVRFVPRREYWEMPKINAVSDVLIVHLKDYPFMAATIPSKIQVAMASGRPILAGVRGDAAQLVRDARAGLVCDPEQPEAMARTMRQLVDLAPEELNEMGRHGLEFYTSHLSLAAAGASMDEIFQGVIGEPAGPVERVAGSAGYPVASKS